MSETTSVQRKIVFVYNAQSGLLNKLKDAVHKTFRPSTYPCSLCDITYSPVHMYRRWANFVATLPVPVEFSYIDLMPREVEGRPLSYPVALLQTGDSLSIWLEKGEIDAAKGLDELIALVTKRAAELDQYD